MNWYAFFKSSQASKTVILMRGLSGSGKSTLARQLGKGGVVLAADDFFEQTGEYKFDPNKTGHAHKWNLMRMVRAMERGISPIVIDNTLVEAWMGRAYAQEAIKHGYEIKIEESQTPWRFNAEELAKRNQHGVPLESIQQSLGRWHPNMTVDDILKSKMPGEA